MAYAMNHVHLKSPDPRSTAEWYVTAFDFTIISDVAINTDRSVRKLKGSSRPVNTLAHRAKVLASLQCIDKVVFFE